MPTHDVYIFYMSTHRGAKKKKYEKENKMIGQVIKDESVKRDWNFKS